MMVIKSFRNEPGRHGKVGYLINVRDPRVRQLGLYHGRFGIEGDHRDEGRVTRPFRRDSAGRLRLSHSKMDTRSLY